MKTEKNIQSQKNMFAVIQKLFEIRRKVDEGESQEPRCNNVKLHIRLLQLFSSE